MALSNLAFGSRLSKYLIENLFLTFNHNSDFKKVSEAPDGYISSQKAIFTSLSFFVCKCIRKRDKDLI